MTYKEGLTIAEKYGLENEFDDCYDAVMYNDPAISEDEAVAIALQEWDLN